MPPVKQKNGQHGPAVTRVVIQGGIFVPSVAASRVRPNENCAFVVINKDGPTTYELRLTTYTNKSTGAPVNQSDLFTTNVFKHAIAAGPNLIARTVNPAGVFGNGGGQFPYTTYEFIMELWDSGGANHLADLDPDFDITP
jgi:hypothetical protein